MAAKHVRKSVAKAEPMVHATHEDLAYFKGILLKERTEIFNQSHLLLLSGEMGISKNGDEADQARSEALVNEKTRIIERKGQLLQKIEYALKRIDEGSYFRCEVCDELLNISRLKARPVASLCIACKEEQEAREKSFA